MVFINDRLGNGFRINSIDSTLNQEHYFGGAKKNVRLRLRGLSGTLNLGEGIEFALTSSTVIELSWSLYDTQNALIDSGGFSERVFDVGPDDVDVKFDTNLLFKVSASDAPFADTDFIFSFKDDSSDAWSAYKDVKVTGSGYFKAPDDDGFREFEMQLRSVGRPEIALNDQKNQRFFKIDQLSNIYVYKDVKLEYSQPLADDGVEEYKIIDNQNVEFEFVNRNLMPIVEDSIRETSYYGWQNVNILQSTPSKVISAPEIKAIANDSVNNLYAVGRFSENSIENWIVFKSVDGGDSWEVIDSFDRDGGFDSANAIAIDSNDNIYVVGSEGVTGEGTGNWIVRKSTTGASGSFVYIDSFDRDSSTDVANAIAIDSSGSIYVVGHETVTGESQNWIVRKSTTGASGSFVYIDSFDRDGGLDQAAGIAIDSGDNVYVVGFETVTGESQNWIVRSSTDGTSGSFTYIDSFDRDGGSDVASAIAIDSGDNIYVVGHEIVTGEGSNWIVRKSTDGTSASFVYVDSFDRDGLNDSAQAIAIDSGDNIYVVGNENVSGESQDWIVRKSTTGTSASFVYVDSFDRDGLTDSAQAITIDSGDNIYVVGKSGGIGLVKKGFLTANSASLGPRVLATSIGYVQEEPVSGSLIEAFQLSNISEFPHSQGIFQMPNLVLGTKDSGKLGRDEDSIVRVRFFGSVVRVLWPKQDDQLLPVKGLADLSSGERAGKLTTEFQPGEFFQVTDFDHVALYGYARVEESGSLDSIEIRVEKRPLRDLAFAKEQSLEISTSSSLGVDVAVAEVQDFIYKKPINYGNTGDPNQGFVIDVPLTNVKDFRVSARHTNGQNEANKNFIMWARFIDSETET